MTQNSKRSFGLFWRRPLQDHDPRAKAIGGVIRNQLSLKFTEWDAEE